MFKSQPSFNHGSKVGPTLIPAGSETRRVPSGSGSALTLKSAEGNRSVKSVNPTVKDLNFLMPSCFPLNNLLSMAI